MNTMGNMGKSENNCKESMRSMGMKQTSPSLLVMTPNAYKRAALHGTASAVALASALIVSVVFSHQAAAQTTFAPGANLNSSTPMDGDVWNLQGDAFVSRSPADWYVKVLPYGSMTIQGVNGVSTITMSDGPNHTRTFGYDNPPDWSNPPAATLNLSNVAFLSDNARVLTTQWTKDLVVNISNSVSFSRKPPLSSDAEGIYVANGIILNGAAGSRISFSDLSFGFYTSFGNVTFAGSYDSVDIVKNQTGVFTKAAGFLITGESYGDIHVDNNGAGARIAGNVVIDPTRITGNLSISGNTAGGVDAGSITINPGRVAGTLAINNNGGTPANMAPGVGGLSATSLITISGSYGAIEMIGNKAVNSYTPINGGALSAGIRNAWLGTPANISVTPSAGTMAVRNNFATKDGGAFYATGNVTVSTGGTTDFTGNTATGNGGAIQARHNVILTASGGGLVFSDNNAGAKGGAIWAGGDVTLNASGGDMSFTGNKHGDPVANAIYLDNTNGGQTTTFNTEAGRTVAFFDPVVNNADNGLVAVTKTGAGMVSFDGSKYSAVADLWSELYADTVVRAGTFEIANNAVYGALAADATTPPSATSFTSAAGTMVQGGVAGTLRADNVTLNGDLSIAGRQPGTRGVFNIYSNTLTLGGGTVYFNTFLNDGGVQNTDLLVLNLNGSTTSGQSIIRVTNAGGTGALTVGDGIKLVQTNNGTTTGAFTLGNRVAAGAYEYELFHGGNEAAGGDVNDQNWYLRSTMTNPDDPNGPEVPLVRSEVPVSMVIPPLALEYGYAMLDTLHERIGEARFNASAPVTEERVVWCKDPAKNFKCTVRVPVATMNGARKDETVWGRSGWARLIGDRGFHDTNNFARRGPDYNYTFGGIQAGFDVFAREQGDGTVDKAGIYVGYGQITSNVKGQFGDKAGSVDMDAYTVAGYWTHHSPSGWYTDAVIQGTWYSADAKSVYGQNLKPDGFGILGSLEGGYSFKLGNGFTVEPQAQIVYQNVSFGNSHDAYGFVRFDDGDSLRGRLGLRVTKSWNTADQGREPRLVTAWLRANVWHEFMGKARTSWGSMDGQNMTPFSSSLGGSWGEIGAGVTAQVFDKVSIFATGAYNRSLDNKGREGWAGRLGATVKW